MAWNPHSFNAGSTWRSSLASQSHPAANSTRERNQVRQDWLYSLRFSSSN
jgi:hypothetical protein